MSQDKQEAKIYIRKQNSFIKEINKKSAIKNETKNTHKRWLSCHYFVQRAEDRE